MSSKIGESKSIDKIYELLELYQRVDVFSVGNGVKWKRGLRNRIKPEYNEFAVVAEIRSEPFFDEQEGAGSMYYREPLDLRIAISDEDGDLQFLWVDSRRFEKI
ncbi:hypothetical protein [Azospirillum brasilense]|uniref:hypothetical protein n=1 Tax=Azospirillum brasilense TaxID=192 RepID=UPI0013B452B6|nr:hypothetical protein [Azospirillum brasilense]